MSRSSSDEDDIMFYMYLRLKRRKKRRYWIHPYIEKNINCRAFVAARELKESDDKFISMYRMTKDSFLQLVDIIGPHVARQDTNLRECISAEERLLITLRYLATGSTFISLGLYFARGDCTISLIIQETTRVIWEVLKPIYMDIPSTEKWEAIARRFYELWNLPNCLGALDGKHIRIQKLSNSGSTNYNYKLYHSLVLLAVCDADGMFTMIETGFAGRNSDGGIFRASNIGGWLKRGALNLPASACLPYDEGLQRVPYFFVGDNAFPLTRYLLRPYPTGTIDNKQRIFNYRISRARKTIECTFGMMTQKFQVLSTSIRLNNYATIVNVIKSLCVLHNYVRMKDGLQYSSSVVDPHQNPHARNLNLREEIITLHPSTSAATVRNYLANYFIKPQASLPWQYNCCL